MSREILPAARQIRGEVRSLEDGFDLALASNARLVASLLDARRETGVPVHVGRAALNHALEAISHGAKARESLLQAHGELASLSLRELATGDLSECPDEWVKGQLSVVPAASGCEAA
jgi:hypothetical protein